MEDHVIVASARGADGSVVDVRLGDGRIQEVTPAGGQAERAYLVADGLMALPEPVEPHCHLDRILTIDDVAPSGGLDTAVGWWHERRTELSAQEVADRARAGLRRFEAFGVRRLRTHVDSAAEVRGTALEGVAAASAELQHLDVQVVAFAGVPLTGREGADNRAALRSALEAGAHLVGGAAYRDPDPRGALETMRAVASEAGAGLDVHVDEVTDPSVCTLEWLAALIGDGFPHGVTASHAVSLAFHPLDDQRRIAERLAAAGIAVITLPATNLYLQAREHPGAVGAAPRALTALEALRDAGVVVAAGADNVEDPFCPINSGDPRETARLLVLAGHQEPIDALHMISTNALAVLGEPTPGLEPGAGDALVLVDAPSVPAFIAGNGRIVHHLAGTGSGKKS